MVAKATLSEKLDRDIISELVIDQVEAAANYRAEVEKRGTRLDGPFTGRLKVGAPFCKFKS